jgi:hypothetical protein
MSSQNYEPSNYSRISESAESGKNAIQLKLCLSPTCFTAVTSESMTGEKTVKLKAHIHCYSISS